MKQRTLLPVYLVLFYASWSCYILLVTPLFGQGPLFLALESMIKLSLWGCFLVHSIGNLVSFALGSAAWALLLP